MRCSTSVVTWSQPGCFLLEELEKLHIKGATIELFDPEVFEALSLIRETALKELILLNCDIAPETLAEILTFPEGLTHLTMEGQWWDKMRPHECYFDPREYVEEIVQSSSAGLEYLDLDIWEAAIDEPLDFSCL